MLLIAYYEINPIQGKVHVKKSIFLPCCNHFSYANAMNPEISIDAENRLRVVGSFTAVPHSDQKADAGPPLENLKIRLRTIVPEDFGTEAEPGPVTRQRASSLMKYYDGGPKTVTNTLTNGFPLWNRRLLEKSPATVYVLETEDNRFIGHIGLGRQKPDQFVFFSVIEEEFQRLNITRTALMYLLDTFLPTLCTHGITKDQTTPFESILITMDVKHPLQQIALKEFLAFGASRPKLNLHHTVAASSADTFLRYAEACMDQKFHHMEEFLGYMEAHPDQKFEYMIDPALKRTEHRWTIEIPKE